MKNVFATVRIVKEDGSTTYAVEWEREREREKERCVFFSFSLSLSAYIRLADVQHQHEVTEPQVNIEQHIALATINCSIRFSFFSSSVDRS